MRVVVLLLALFSALFSEEIDKYRVDVNILPSGKLHIVEDIAYNFGLIKRHGIYRDIPITIKYKNRVIDLGFNSFKVLLNGSYVNYEKSNFYDKKSGKNIRLKIGSADRYVSAIQNYRISYDINKIVMPHSKDRDIISFNAIGNGWKVPIKEAEITYHLPPALNRQNIIVKVYTGKYGSKANRSIIKWLDNYNFKVTVKKLTAYSGVTIDLIFNRYALEQNGLDNLKVSLFERIMQYLYLIIIVPIALFIKKLHKQYVGFVDNRSIAVMYEPPKDMTVLQAGLILDTVADNKDYAAALLELAYRGYITIEQNLEDNIILKATNKNRDNLDIDLKMLLNELLPTKDSTYIFMQRDESEANYLRGVFEKINSKIYDIGVSKGYFKERPYDSKKSFIKKALLAILPFVAYFVYYIINQLGSEALAIVLFPLIFSIAGITVMMQKTIFTTIFGAIFIIAGFLPLITDIDNSPITISQIVFGPIGFMIALIVYLIYLYNRVGKYTQKGAYAKTHLLGLEQFIKRVKKDEIKYRLQSDPLYLERLLPYAVLFGETKHWVSLFTELNVNTPIWYSGDISYLGEFDHNIDSAASYIDNSSSSSSGFGGTGGFSGGGGGGGGGGSW